MSKPMYVKFEKYWGEIGILMSIASILDPHFKMFSVEWTFERLYLEDECKIMVEDVKSKLKSLFDKYCNAYKTSEAAMNSSKTSYNESSLYTNDFYACLNSRTMSIERKSELDEYLDEQNLKCMDPKFDALKWWSPHCSKFPVLSKMAKDIFGIPITTVASESAFSAGGVYWMTTEALFQRIWWNFLFVEVIG
ncbi:putative HAT dimerization domain, ribonuclease H-like superfamily, hAT-like transposase, RNase-H [Helianthus annuus]|nr:putative HAT dimerization domain, ribonuclease H-like superfamily, hAT-like transposase, RNase-H [Helianthus annuus]